MIELIDQDKTLSLYLHVPFCNSKCGYCAFYSVPSACAKQEEIDKYYSILTAKLEAFLEEYKKPFYTIFIGGGNPGFLGYDRLLALLKLAQRYGKSQEVTIEINPENVNENIVKLFPYLTRISIGIQSFDKAKLKTLERNTNLEHNQRALTLLSKLKGEYGFNLNADLICCVPGESEAILKSDIDTLLSFDVDHISLYALAFEEGTSLVKKYVPLRDEEQIALLKSAWTQLKEKGYEHYEVSNFARDGKYCLHNKVYWSLGQYIGFGPSAESSLGYKKVVSLREKNSLEEYLKNPELDADALTNKQAQEEYLLTVLRTKAGINKEEYFNRFNLDFDALYSESISELDKSFYKDDEKAFSVTEEGFLMLDTIIFKLFCML